MTRKRYRRASEIGEWYYCQRAWWLHHVQGHRPAARARLERGHSAHEVHSRSFHRANRLRALALALLGLAALLLLIGLFLS